MNIEKFSSKFKLSYENLKGQMKYVEKFLWCKYKCQIFSANYSFTYFLNAYFASFKIFFLINF